MSKGEDNKDEMLVEVAVQKLDVIERFHNLGFLHRDIKPSNFRVKDGEVYLVDFGTYKSYLDENGDHIKDGWQGFSGTYEYASIRIHQG